MTQTETEIRQKMEELEEELRDQDWGEMPGTDRRRAKEASNLLRLIANGSEASDKEHF